MLAKMATPHLKTCDPISAVAASVDSVMVHFRTMKTLQQPPV